MQTRELSRSDRPSVIDLWERCSLTRRWNPPEADFDRAVNGSTSAVLGMFDSDALVAAVMVGDDGHRGWIYYLAVDPAHQRRGLGRAMMKAAESWLVERGVRKVELMVRSSNHDVEDFYEAVGYKPEDVRVLSRWLVEVPT